MPDPYNFPIGWLSDILRDAINHDAREISERIFPAIPIQEPKERFFRLEEAAQDPRYDYHQGVKVELTEIPVFKNWGPTSVTFESPDCAGYAKRFVAVDHGAAGAVMVVGRPESGPTAVEDVRNAIREIWKGRRQDIIVWDDDWVEPLNQPLTPEQATGHVRDSVDAFRRWHEAMQILGYSVSGSGRLDPPSLEGVNWKVDAASLPPPPSFPAFDAPNRKRFKRSQRKR